MNIYDAIFMQGMTQKKTSLILASLIVNYCVRRIIFKLK